MKLYPQQLFHIYNQGNNRRQIFFSDENYKFFLWKMRAYLLPFGDMIAWSLMPNHYHWLFYVEKVEVSRKSLRSHVDQVEYLRRIVKYGEKAKKVERDHTRTASGDSRISLNAAIGVLQKGYTSALNKERGWSGSLFRKNFKAKDGWIDEFVTLKKANGQTDLRFLPGNDYAYNCLCYIHNNPVDAKLAIRAEDWIYSSARDYKNQRSGTLCNLILGREIIQFI